MAKHIQLARCYYNDKDIADILSNPRLSQRALLKIAQGKGVIMNPSETRENIVSYLSRMPFDWHDLKSLAKQLEKTEREERRGITRLDPLAEEEIEKAVTVVKDSRVKNKNEEFKIEKHNNQLIIRGKYIEIDYSKTKAFQREEREYAVEIDLSPTQPSIQFTHNQKAREFVADLIKKLKPTPESIIDKPIDLSEIKDAALRTDFFLKLRRLMPGFRQLDVVDLKVDRRLDVSGEDPEDDLEDIADEKAEADAKSMVKGAALHGHGLLTTELYQKMRELGYYVFRMQWSSVEIDGDGRLMEFEAGFDDPITAQAFHYDLKKAVPNESDKKLGLTQTQVTNGVRNKVRRLLADAAYLALDEIRSNLKNDET